MRRQPQENLPHFGGNRARGIGPGDAVICPPFTDLRTLQTLVEADGYSFRLGAQNVHPEEKGAFTGEISPAMLSKLQVE